MNFPKLPHFSMPSLPSVPVVEAKVAGGLRSLPTFAFALLLGGAFVVTAFAVWYTFIIGYMPWPEAVAETRIKSLAVGLWILLGLIGLVMVTLAFGKVERLSVSGSVVSGSVEFDDGSDDDDDHHHHHHDDGPLIPPPLLPPAPPSDPPPPSDDDDVPPGPHNG